MICGIYAIRDCKSTFMPATVDVNDASAIRNFEFACQQQDSLMRTHRKDFSLWKLGTFDNETAMIDVLVPPTQIADGSSLEV